MSEIDIVRAVDGAKLVKASRVNGQTVVQVWYGGTTVNVFDADTGKRGSWEEIGVWTVMDEKGRPVGEGEIEHHMAMEVARIQEEMADE